MRRLSGGLALAALHLALAGQADATEFPGVTKYQYFHQIAWRLREPAMLDGVLVDEDFRWRDKTVFSNALYADLLPLAGTDTGPVGLATLGATFGDRELIPYVLAGGLVGYREPERRYAKLLAGLRYRRPIWRWFHLDGYAQAELDTADGFDWEVGLSPVRSRWFSAAALAHLHLARFDVFETNLGFPLVKFSAQAMLDSGVRRYALSASLRDYRRMKGWREGGTVDAEVQVAWVRGGPLPPIGIWESRVMLYASTVGGGPRGEARPGLHLNLSYLTDNPGGYRGFGAELGFGAKQIDASEAQQLYFTVFYNYAGYFYRYPSLRWGLGLVGQL